VELHIDDFHHQGGGLTEEEASVEGTDPLLADISDETALQEDDALVRLQGDLDLSRDPPPPLHGAEVREKPVRSRKNKAIVKVRSDHEEKEARAAARALEVLLLEISHR